MSSQPQLTHSVSFTNTQKPVASVILEVQFLAFRSLSAPPASPASASASAAPAAAVEATTEEDGQRHAAAVVEASATTTNSSSSNGGGETGHRAPASRLALLALAVGASAASAFGVIALYHLFVHSPAWLADAVGSGVCSILLAAGFVPQLALMCRQRSSKGFSLGLSALDLTGSAMSIAALALAPLAEPGAPVDVGGIVPYAVIVGFQLLVVFLAFAIYPDPGRFAHCAQWSEWSMEAVLNKQGGGRGEQDSTAKADDAAPTAVEEGKGTGDRDGDGARA